MELLVARARGSQCELLDAVAGEARVRVAVDESRDRGQPAPVDLLDVAGERSQLAHLADRDDASVLAEDVGALDHVEEPERLATKGRGAAGRRGDLREVADQ